tara:strand:- start:53 stop:202 length:150 start_codon:yes stop_codon:yes gene_type:complete
MLTQSHKLEGRGWETVRLPGMSLYEEERQKEQQQQQQQQQQKGGFGNAL